MHSRFLITSVALLAFSACLATKQAASQTQLPEFQPLKGELGEQEGAWQNWRVEGSIVALRVLNLVAKAEPKPALSIQLMPNAFHVKEGNAAIFYLQAMGFFEQTGALKAKTEFERKNYDAATAAEKPLDEVPPQSWRVMRPENLPIEQVKEYLNYTSFQSRYLTEAVQRRHCDFDRHIRDVENPIGYLLPEIQVMRELARTQTLRSLLAIAENRTDDAVAIFGQQLALGSHLSQEPFLVSNLVGIACASMGWSDALYLCEHQGAPNLYWAIAALPNPLVDMRPALAYEREFLFEQVKLFREVDETPRSSMYWKSFVDRFAESIKDLDSPMLEFGKSGMTVAIAAGVPGAKRFLIGVEGMTAEQLDELPNTQVYFLAVRRFYEHSRDEFLKYANLPHADREKGLRNAQKEFARDLEEYGLITAPSAIFLPAIQAALTAQTRLTQQLALLQTVESIRHHMAVNNNRLPNALSELDLPVPLDPATGKPFQYVRHTQGATLTGERFPGIRYQFELRVQDVPK